MTELFEFALDPAVSPARILLGHSYDQGSDCLHELEAANSLSFGRPFESNQPTMPPQDRVRRHNGCHSIQSLAAKALCLHGESPSLLVGQPQPPALHLLLQDAVLLDQILDDLLLNEDD